MTASLAVALLLAGCGGDDGGSAATTTEETTTTTTEATIEVDIQLNTSNGLIGQNIDDESCDWNDVRYEVSDANADEILDIGDLPTEGDVLGLMPNYECRLEATIVLPAVDFYEVTLSGVGDLGDQWEVTQTFEQDDLEAGLVATVVPDP